MFPILQSCLALIDRLQVGLVDQGRALWGMTTPLSANLAGGQSSQLIINKGHKLVHRFLVAITPFQKEGRDIFLPRTPQGFPGQTLQKILHP